MDDIDLAEYQYEIETAVSEVMDSEPETREEAHSLIEDVVKNHEWFTRTHYSAELYGSIIKYRTVSDPEQKGWEYSFLSEEDPDEAVKRIAFNCFGADVTEKVFSLSSNL